MPDDTHTGFNDHASPNTPRDRDIIPVARPVNRAQIDELHKQLSQPKPQQTLTPMGSVAREARTQQDHKILKEIEAIRARLEMRRKAAKQAFERATRGQGM
ncbi:MAG: hypothetical protein NCW75_14005 [Phycisphaera sp.]|nr:MAG: hypothetical protein NCW75_14005 [Phycisphaera sp.]